MPGYTSGHVSGTTLATTNCNIKLNKTCPYIPVALAATIYPEFYISGVLGGKPLSYIFFQISSQLMLWEFVHDHIQMPRIIPVVYP